LIPIISAATQSRTEGYFRLEWRLADQRTHLMAKGRPFLLPVVIDGTRDAEAHVPDSFTEVQWTRLPGGETPLKFAERVSKLLSGTVAGVARSEHVESADPGPASPRLADQSDDKKPKRWLAPVIAGAVVVLLALAISRPWDKVQSPAAAAKAVVSLSEARRLAEQARALLLKPSGGPSKYDTAALLCDRALVLDPTDAEVWAIASQVDTKIAFHSFDRSEKRIESAQSKAAKARNLAPGSFEARLAQGMFQAMIGGQPMAAEAEATLRALRTENPREYRVFDALGVLLRDQGRGEEAVACFDEAARLPDGAVSGLSQKAWALRGLWRFDEADAALDRSIALQPIAGNVGLKVFLDLSWRGDPDRALATLHKLPADELTMDVGVAAAVRLYRWRREPAEVLKFLASVPREWMTWSIWGPKAALTGDANAGLNKLAAARTDWQTALALVEQRLAITPNDRNLFEWKAYLEASLGESAKAEESWQRSREAPGQGMALLNVEKIHRVATPEQVIDELERRAQDVRDRLEHIRPFPVAFISAADLRLNPAWDRVRSLPRFQALQATLDADPRFSPTAKATAATSTAPDQKSVAVLAFANLSGDKEQEYFSDGLTEEILNALARERDLRVPGRSSSFSFKGRNASSAEIARALNVARLVEGSVRKSGSKVRISVSLTRASDGFSEEIGTFTEELADIFALQDKVARIVVEKLTRRTSTNAVALLTKNPDAYDAYLRGRALQTRAASLRIEAAAHYERAVALDPAFALAWARLAEARFRDYSGLFDRSPELVATSREAIDRALAAQPDLPEGLIMRANWTREVEFDFAAAQRALDRAEALQPATAELRFAQALLARDTGNWPEALRRAREALELDPQNGDYTNTLAVNLYRPHGDLADADRLLARAMTIQGAGSIIPFGNRVGVRTVWRGAVSALRMVDRAPVGQIQLDLTRADVLASLGRMDEARLSIDKIERDAQAGPGVVSMLLSRAAISASLSLPLLRAVGREDLAQRVAQELSTLALKQMHRGNRAPWVRFSLILSETTLDRREAALAALEEWRRESESMPSGFRRLHEFNRLATPLYALLGEAEQAGKLLRECAADGYLPELSLRHALFFAPIRDDPRFQELMKQQEAWAKAQPDPDDP
jgi:TolB-like protein/Flp pilus assembly protein TadD